MTFYVLISFIVGSLVGYTIAINVRLHKENEKLITELDKINTAISSIETSTKKPKKSKKEITTSEETN